jgi:phage tail-like protein
MVGARQDPYMAFNFLVEIHGLVVGGFREVKGLESHVEVKEYAEGGLNGHIHKIPGETRYPSLVLSRGMTDVDTMWSWYDSVSRGVITRRNATLMLLDAKRMPVMWWDIRDALPVKWTGPSFDATRSSEVAIESIELVHRGITKQAAR